MFNSVIVSLGMSSRYLTKARNVFPWAVIKTRLPDLIVGAMWSVQSIWWTVRKVSKAWGLFGYIGRVRLEISGRNMKKHRWREKGLTWTDTFDYYGTYYAVKDTAIWGKVQYDRYSGRTEQLNHSIGVVRSICRVPAINRVHWLLCITEKELLHLW